MRKWTWHIRIKHFITWLWTSTPSLRHRPGRIYISLPQIFTSSSSLSPSHEPKTQSPYSNLSSGLFVSGNVTRWKGEIQGVTKCVGFLILQWGISSASLSTDYTCSLFLDSSNTSQSCNSETCLCLCSIITITVTSFTSKQLHRIIVKDLCL